MRMSYKCLSCNDLKMEDGFEMWSKKTPNLMIEWLGLGSTHFQQRESETANGNEGRSFKL